VTARLLFTDIINYYNHCARWIEDDAEAMGWSSQFNQKLRFDIFNYLVDLTGLSVLDVGCGDAAFYHYLNDQTIDCQYYGIDISDEMIKRAKHRCPGVAVRQSNLFDYHILHDVVVSSGAISIHSQSTPMTFLSSVIDHFLILANQHVLFNLLSIHSPKKSSLLNYYDPAEVLTMCLQKSPFATVHHGYLPNDFTVHLIKRFN
jgi:SAM-dependent methyltransferase